MEIQVLGGAHKIGGNRILVKVGNSMFWLDMGSTHGYKLDLIDFNVVRGFSLKRLVSENIFPLEAIANSAKEENGNKTINLLLSHPHLDHYSLITYYTAWVEANIKVRLFTPKDLYNILKTRFELGNLKKILINLDPRSIEETDLENIKVKAINVDHSIDASYGYYVETKEGNIGYTGDFRFTTTKEFDKMERSFQGLDVLITEATRICSHSLLTEDQVKDNIKEIMERYGGSTIVFVVGWYTHTTRVRSIIESCAGRKVVLHPKIAALLQAADEEILKHPRVYILQMKETEEIPIAGKKMTLSQVNDERGNVVVVIPEAQKLYIWREETKDSIYIRPKDVIIASLSEPYDEESTRAILELSDYVLRQLKVPIYHVHASGHASIHQIADFVNAIKPKKVYIIHSPVPEALAPLIDKKIKVEMP